MGNERGKPGGNRFRSPRVEASILWFREGSSGMDGTLRCHPFGNRAALASRP